jgi:CO/xanthine dehydrogenase Mo-binding subunit
VLSPHPHVHTSGVSAEAAKAMPGVLAVVTGLTCRR